MTTQEQAQNTLKPVHYWNVAAYLLYFVASFVIAATNLILDNATLSAKYQTIVTPAGIAFSIWGLIFLSELVWVCSQTSRKYRSDSLTLSVGYNFVMAYVAQTVWTFVFGYEKMILSLVAMIGILIPLVRAMESLAKLRPSSTLDYWILKFPFELHGAWICAATIVNMNVVLVFLEASAAVQLYAAFASLAALILVATYYAYRKVYTVPVVLAWASYFIHKELLHPKDLIANTFTAEAIDFVQLSSLVVSIVALVIAVVFLGYRRFKGEPTSSSTSEYTAIDNEM